MTWMKIFNLLIFVTVCYAVPTNRFKRNIGYETTTSQLDELRTPEPGSKQLLGITTSEIEPNPTINLPKADLSTSLLQDQNSETDPISESTDTSTDSPLKNDEEDSPIINSEDSTLRTPKKIEENDHIEGSASGILGGSPNDQTLTDTSNQNQGQTGEADEHGEERSSDFQHPEKFPHPDSKENLNEESTTPISISDQKEPGDESENADDLKQIEDDLPEQIVTTMRDLDNFSPPSSKPELESETLDQNVQATTSIDKQSLETLLSDEAQADEPAAERKSSGEDLASIEKSKVVPDQLPEEKSLQSDYQSEKSTPQGEISSPGIESKIPGQSSAKNLPAKEVNKMGQLPKYSDFPDDDNSSDDSSDLDSSEELSDESAPNSTGSSSTNLSMWDRLQAINPLQLQNIQGYLPTWETLNRMQSMIPSWESINEMQSMIPWDTINQLQTDIPTWMNQLQTNVPRWMDQLQSTSPWQTMTQLVNQWQPLEQIQNWSRSYPELGNMMNAFMNLFRQ